MKIYHTNQMNIPLAMLPWYLNDTYDHNKDPTVISATKLLKPLRQTILTDRIDNAVVDLSTLTSSRIGTAIHDAIERGWMNPEAVKAALKVNGTNFIDIDKYKVNPEPGFDPKEVIPVYVEQRIEKELLGYKVTGKFDIVINGVLGDIKNTSVYTYMNQTNAQKYILQGSIYRWLNPDIITANYMEIYHQFTDWSPIEAQTKKDKGYPESKMFTVRYELLSLEDTEAFIKEQLQTISKLKELPQEQLPECTDEELWVDPPVYKYYADPNSTARSTKNFDNAAEAYSHMSSKGKGIVIEVKGKVKACKYCSAFPVCTQAVNLVNQGRLT